MNDYNSVKAEQSGMWDDDNVVKDKRDAAEASKPQQSDRRKERNASRAKNFREKSKGQSGSGRPDFSAVKETPEQAPPMYNVGTMNGYIPSSETYAHNLDFSTFPLLCERTYRDMQVVEARLDRKMPFSGFLHHCVVALNANLLHIATHENKEGDLLREGDVASYLMDLAVPGPIGAYFASIGETCKLEGNVVRTNLPTIARPKDSSDGVGTSGTFGQLTAENHNAYECYIAPRVTVRRIQATLAGTHDWTPLTPALMNGATATPNFLGFGPIEAINPEGRNALSGLRFPEDDDLGLETRLQYCAELHSRVKRVLSGFSDKYKIVPALAPRRVTPGNVGFLELLTLRPSTQPIVEVNAHSWSPCSAGATLASMIYINGLKRRRNINAPGYCGLQGGQVIEGWEHTRNSNFECVAPFGIIAPAIDDPGLRTGYYCGYSSAGSRIVEIDRFITRSFRIEKR